MSQIKLRYNSFSDKIKNFQFFSYCFEKNNFFPAIQIFFYQLCFFSLLGFNLFSFFFFFFFKKNYFRFIRLGLFILFYVINNFVLKYSAGFSLKRQFSSLIFLFLNNFFFKSVDVFNINEKFFFKSFNDLLAFKLDFLKRRSSHYSENIFKSINGSLQVKKLKISSTVFFNSSTYRLPGISGARKDQFNLYQKLVMKFPDYFLRFKFLSFWFFQKIFEKIRFDLKKPFQKHGSVIIFRKDLSLFSKKPSFIRNFTRAKDTVFWRIFKNFYKNSRVFIVKNKKFTKKVAKYSIIFSYFNSFFSLTHLNVFLRRLNDLKRLYFMRKGLNLILFTKRLYQLKRFCTLKRRHNIFTSMVYRCLFTLKLFISFYFKISIKNAVSFILQGLIYVNGVLIRYPNFRLKPNDFIFFNCSIENLILFPVNNQLSCFVLAMEKFKSNLNIDKDICKSTKSVIKADNALILKFLFYKKFLTQNIQLNQNSISFFSTNLVQLNGYKSIFPLLRSRFFNDFSFIIDGTHDITNFSYHTNIFYKIYKSKYQVHSMQLTFFLLKYLEQRFNQFKY